MSVHNVRRVNVMHVRILFANQGSVYFDFFSIAVTATQFNNWLATPSID